MPPTSQAGTTSREPSQLPPRGAACVLAATTCEQSFPAANFTRLDQPLRPLEVRCQALSGSSFARCWSCAPSTAFIVRYSVSLMSPSCRKSCKFDSNWLAESSERCELPRNFPKNKAAIAINPHNALHHTMSCESVSGESCFMDFRQRCIAGNTRCIRYLLVIMHIRRTQSSFQPPESEIAGKAGDKMTLAWPS